MSRGEFHAGKLRKVDLQGKSINNWCKEKFHSRFPHTFLDSYYKDDYVMAVVDRFDEYVYLNNVLYELVEHYISDDCYHSTLIENKDGTFSFSCSFHNGGTCLKEILEEELQNINK